MLTAPDTLSPAPFFADVAEGPAGVSAAWVHARDGTRLRMAVWPTGDKGTVLMFPGRTEYVEKYGRVAHDLAQAGYGMVSFDWRGQGLADRPLSQQPDMGHVHSFATYQHDVAAFLDALAPMDLPKPWFLLGHSMGGCIGLRALYDGLAVQAAAFTAPMWGLEIAPLLRLASPLIMALSGPLGYGTTFAPTTGPWAPLAFEDNTLTTDRAQFDYMSRQTEQHPELALGGPSITWVKAATEETQALMALPPLDLPALSLLGTEERVVDAAAIRTRMASWPRGSLLSIDGARHEVLMESPTRRTASLAAIISFFDKTQSA